MLLLHPSTIQIQLVDEDYIQIYFQDLTFNLKQQYAHGNDLLLHDAPLDKKLQG